MCYRFFISPHSFPTLAHSFARSKTSPLLFSVDCAPFEKNPRGWGAPAALTYQGPAFANSKIPVLSGRPSTRLFPFNFQLSTVNRPRSRRSHSSSDLSLAGACEPAQDVSLPVQPSTFDCQPPLCDSCTGHGSRATEHGSRRAFRGKEGVLPANRLLTPGGRSHRFIHVAVDLFAGITLALIAALKVLQVILHNFLRRRFQSFLVSLIQSCLYLLVCLA